VAAPGFRGESPWLSTARLKRIAEALVLALTKVIEAAPDEPHKNALRANIYEQRERISKGDRGLH